MPRYRCPNMDCRFVSKESDNCPDCGVGLDFKDVIPNYETGNVEYENPEHAKQFKNYMKEAE